MFFVCDEKNGKFGVLDTDDGICEYYSKRQLIEISKSVNILGVSSNNVGIVDKEFVRAKVKLLTGKEPRYLDFFDTDLKYIIVSTINDSYVGNSRIKLANYDTNKEFILDLNKFSSILRKSHILNVINSKDCIAGLRYDYGDIPYYVYSGSEYRPFRNYLYYDIDKVMLDVIKKLPDYKRSNRDYRFICEEFKLKRVYRIDEKYLVIKVVDTNTWKDYYIKLNMNTGKFNLIEVKGYSEYYALWEKMYYFCSCDYSCGTLNLYRENRR